MNMHMTGEQLVFGFMDPSSCILPKPAGCNWIWVESVNDLLTKFSTPNVNLHVPLERQIRVEQIDIDVITSAGEFKLYDYGIHRSLGTTYPGGFLSSEDGPLRGIEIERIDGAWVRRIRSTGCLDSDVRST